MQGIKKTYHIDIKAQGKTCAFFIWISLCTCSCVTLKDNYLGQRVRLPENLRMGAVQFMKLDSVRKKTDLQLDSLVKSFSSGKHSRHLKANEINLLFADFGADLDYDKLYSSILPDMAGLKLMQSAEFYDRVLQKNGKVRRAINRGERGNGIPRNTLQKSRRFLYSPAIRKKILNAFSGKKANLADSLLKQLPKTSVWKEAYCSVYRKNDRVINAFYGLFNFAGNKLFKRHSTQKSFGLRQRKVARDLQSQLEPFDIVLSKSTNHLAAKIIPGYFGHAAIWLGDLLPGKRKKAGFAERVISKGRHIGIHKKGMMEAITSGVRGSSLKEYAEGEVFLIIRFRSLSTEQKKSILTNAAKQYDKPYDFNFDIESPDMVNCTELVYLLFDFVQWNVSPFMGRFTLFPDDLLKTALEKEQFEIVGLLKDGKFLVNPDKAFVERLINSY